MMFYPINSIGTGTRKDIFTLGPKTRAWLERVRERPALKRALARVEEEEKTQRAKL